jgi:calcineurin-like phosphoesterase family protein
MNYWITTDTHFNHSKMIECCGRPENFEHIILNNLHRCVREDDVLIHLGDICFGKQEFYHTALREVKGKHWLVRGNHDKNTNAWYLSHGWDMVCENFVLDMYGFRILFSHKPQKDNGYSFNIHGHFHNTDHRKHEPQFIKFENGRQLLIALEYNNYQPQKLETIIRKYHE